MRVVVEINAANSGEQQSTERLHSAWERQGTTYNFPLEIPTSSFSSLRSMRSLKSFLFLDTRRILRVSGGSASKERIIMISNVISLNIDSTQLCNNIYSAYTKISSEAIITNSTQHFCNSSSQNPLPFLSFYLVVEPPSFSMPCVQ